MDDKKVISIIEDLVFEDINQEDYWKAVKEAKAFIEKVKTKQLILHIVVGRSEQLFCGECGNKRELKVETDINSDRVCKNRLCKAK